MNNKRIPWNKGLKGQQVAWNKGKKQPKEQTQKYIKSMSKYWNSEDWKNKMSKRVKDSGFRHTEESKAKISEKSKGNKHGLRHGHASSSGSSPTYISYGLMFLRVNKYESYVSKDIKVCKRWSEPAPRGFINFLNDMGERPSGKTLDRIDNNGNYTLKNCRWATQTQQNLNKGIDSRNTSGYKGVMKSSKNRWRANIQVEGKRYFSKSYINIEDANKARKELEDKYGV